MLEDECLLEGQRPGETRATRHDSRTTLTGARDNMSLQKRANPLTVATPTSYPKPPKTPSYHEGIR